MLNLELQNLLKQKPELTICERQQVADIEKLIPKQICFRIKRTNIGGRKICANFRTDTDKLYRYRNSSILKDTNFDLKLTAYQLLWQNDKIY